MDERKSALVIGADQPTFEFIREQLKSAGWDARWAGTTAQAQALIEEREWLLVFLHRYLRNRLSHPVAQKLKYLQPDAYVILLTDLAHPTEYWESPVRSIAGHVDVKPDEEQASCDRLRKCLAEVEELISELEGAVEIHTHNAPGDIVGTSQAIEAVRQQIVQIASTLDPVLISGEVGTGKTHVARSIHWRRYGARLPFSSVYASELRGERPVETFFDREKKVRARGGTLYVKGINEATENTQAKLLQLDYRPSAPIRIIANSTRDLDELVEQGQFSADLRRRFKQHIHLPPLRERREDIPALIEHFATRHGEGRLVRISQKAFQIMERYEWEGNTLQLENTILNALSSRMQTICVRDFRYTIQADVQEK